MKAKKDYFYLFSEKECSGEEKIFLKDFRKAYEKPAFMVIAKERELNRSPWKIIVRMNEEKIPDKYIVALRFLNYGAVTLIDIIGGNEEYSACIGYLAKMQIPHSYTLNGSIIYAPVLFFRNHHNTVELRIDALRRIYGEGRNCFLAETNLVESVRRFRDYSINKKIENDSKFFFSHLVKSLDEFSGRSNFYENIPGIFKVDGLGLEKQFPVAIKLMKNRFAGNYNELVLKTA
jgi:hypothetical protein